MLVISIAIVLIILLLMATSWLEPIMFLLVAGIGIVINRGTNVFLGDISDITNSVAAILAIGAFNGLFHNTAQQIPQGAA